MAQTVRLDTLRIDTKESGTAVSFTNKGIKTSMFTVYADLNNTGDVYIGDKNVSTVNNIPRPQGSVSSYTASSRGDSASGDYFDLEDWFVIADTDNEIIIVEYFTVGKGNE